MNEPIIYLDNAATTFPKPRSVLDTMIETYSRMGVSPGRGSYDLSTDAEQLVETARRKVARFFGALDPERVIFAANATDGLNLAIQGMLNPGDHVVSTRLEHNSVLRPLYHLAREGIITYDLVPFDGSGFVDPDDIEKAITPRTRLVVITHASNVLGTVQPLAEIGSRCARHNVPLLVDSAQSAGVIPIDMQAMQISVLVFTGHKSLLGPTGTGGLVLAPDIQIRTTRFGGTGVDSKSLMHTQSYPHRLEAGTLNLIGIIGLSAGLDNVLEMGLAAIHDREMKLVTRLRDGLAAVDGIQLHCADDLRDHVGLLTVDVKGMAPEDVGAILDGDFSICVRTGLQCAPLAHESIGSYPRGGVRFSLGPFNTDADIDHTLGAMVRIAGLGVE
jgi:cysteine desulfurase / selenocysteine lyase